LPQPLAPSMTTPPIALNNAWTRASATRGRYAMKRGYRSLRRFHTAVCGNSIQQFAIILCRSLRRFAELFMPALLAKKRTAPTRVDAVPFCINQFSTRAALAMSSLVSIGWSMRIR
jgi:hypothetical protein